jgi:hypothetical protein
MSTYYELNKEARLAYQKKYRNEHKEEYNEYHKNYYYVYDKKYAEDYRAKNRDRINKQKMESYHRRLAKKEEEKKQKEIKKAEKIKNVVLHIPESSTEKIFVGISVGKNGNFVLQW